MKSRFCALFLFLCSIGMFAQTFHGGIQGTVTNSAGGTVVDVKVTVTNPETGLTRTAKTGATGTYFISELPIGDYNVTAEKANFRPQGVQGIKVEISSSHRVDFQLAPSEGSAEEVKTEVVEMTGQSPLVNTTRNNLGASLESRVFLELPINGRDFSKLLVLAPGTSGDASGESDAAGSLGLFNIAGNRGRSNNYLIDGTDMNDGYRNLPAINEGGVFGTPATILPLDSLQEISVISNTESEFGRSSGATVDVVTKSGTNSLHGSLYEYFRNNVLDARNFFNTRDQPQNSFHNNQPGFAIGGPFIKDRTFWFVSYEAQLESVGIPTLARVPTTDQINQAIANNGGVTNPVIANLLPHLWPAANRSPDAQGNNLLTSTRASNRVDSIIAKIDQRFGGSDYLTGRYFYGRSDQSFPLALVGGGILPGFNTSTPTNINIASVSYTHIFGMHLLTEIRGGYNRFEQQNLPQDGAFDPSSAGLNLGTSKQDFGLPSISVANFATLGANSSDPRGRVDTNWQFFDNFTYIAGRHSWKFGYELHRTAVDGFFDNGYRGKLTFNTLDNFIGGRPDSGRQAQGNSTRQTFQNNHSLYLQDNFNLFPSLTLNYGVRWEYFGVLGEQKDQFSTLDPTAPRASLSWDIRGDAKTVLRAGWGLYYDAPPQDLFIGQLPFNTFNSGPAYNGIGPNPITFSFSPSPVIQPGVRVFDPATFGATDVFTVDPKLRTPYIQVYNLNVEREIRKNIALQVGYVGSSGRKLFRFADINQVNPATGTAAFPALGFVNQIQSSSSSGYNALLANLRFRNWHGLSSAVNYTWSHSIDNASDGQDFVPNASQPDNSFAPNRERANSNFDMRHHFTWTYNYQLPAFKKWHAVTSGWGVDGVLTMNSGQPFNVNYLFEGNFNGSGEFFGRPDLVGNPFAGVHAPGQFLNLSAFQVPCTLVGGNCVAGTQHFGNLGRNAFVGPAFKNFDFSLVKNNTLTERLKMQFRVDMFNLFNHVNFANPLWPNFLVDFAQNGLTPTGQGQGFLPITATSDVGVGDPFLGSGGPRNIQLAVRFTF
jgi:hypothetical protein